MPLKSDIIIDAGKFDPANKPERVNKFNEAIITMFNSAVDWYEVGAAKYRQMRWAGETGFPVPPISPQGINVTIPSRESGRYIPCRVMYPTSRATEQDRKKSKGSILHFHGGGWTLGDERSQDALLQTFADAGDLAVVSVGYRLAPEDPFPKAPEDCMDAAEYLVKTSEREYGGPLEFIGGESAGAHLTLTTIFQLLKLYPDFKLSGVLLSCGCYDMTHLPQFRDMLNAPVLPQKQTLRFMDAFLPNTSLQQKKEPSVSPFYEDLSKLRGRLPSALFTCGTEDPLLDDTVLMGTRWMMAGGEAMVKIYTGAPHGFILFPPEVLEEARICLLDTKTYIQERLAAAS
ncbi:AB hydrolase superfamily protein B1A11.02 [Lachnellula cervina]|uniref:AB hydrolase superfamily protein B1A11.02 n=1 Tax=Lachnellula cervina TaxID=1316786 RepID=A0A7D8UN95_9HELO|nr:AB hydrolase superfamily protein B1A11.02 [Lachnellula cervina]